jgi:FtsH-binding integral membrane protein
VSFFNQSTIERRGRPEQAWGLASARSIFAATMFLVAANAGLTGLGAYLGRHLSRGQGLICSIIALVLVIGLSAVRQRRAIALTMFYSIGFLLGAGLGPVLAYYAHLPNGPRTIAIAGGLSMLFLAAFGTVGYITRRDLSALARVSFIALFGLIGFGMVMFFVNIPHGQIIYSVVGLVIFAAWTLIDFQRLRRANESDVILLALGIYLDLLNVFLLILRLLQND